MNKTNQHMHNNNNREYPFVEEKLPNKYKAKSPYRSIKIGFAIVVLCMVGITFGLIQLNKPSLLPQPTTFDNLEFMDVDAKPVQLTITVGGDCTLGTDEAFSWVSSFNAAFEEKNDPSWFLANAQQYFAHDDLSIVNFEGTLTERTSRLDKKFAFKGDAEFAQVLVQGDIEAANVANNHSSDYGEESYEDTIEALEAAGVKTFGNDRVCYYNVKGIKVALIGIFSIAYSDAAYNEMVGNIHDAQSNGAQLIIVYGHWGDEYVEATNNTQEIMAHAAIDEGAHLVVGSHPHILQGYEVYNGRYIMYSLGNFCYGGHSNPPEMDCLMFQQTFTIDGNEVAVDDNAKVIPCSSSSETSYNNYQPTPLEGAEAERVMEKVTRRSGLI